MNGHKPLNSHPRERELLTKPSPKGKVPCGITA